MRAVLLAATVVIINGCIAAVPAGSAEPAGSPAVDNQAPSPFLSGTMPMANVQLARAGAQIAILAGGKVLLEDGTPLSDVGPDPAPAHEAITSSVGRHLVYVATTDLHSVITFASDDGGSSWATVGQHDIVGVDAIGDLHVAEADGHFAVLIVEATSTAVSFGLVANAGDGGAGWTVGPAPVGGDISSAGGRFWLTGGVMGDQIFVSANGSAWRSAELPTSSEYWSAAPATEVDGVGVVIPVTSHDPNGPSDVTLFATTDYGHSWKSLTSFAAPLTEFNTTIPTSITPDGRWFAIWPDGSKVVEGSIGATDSNVISPNGLPGNVYDVMFSSASTGVEASSVATCPNGKSSCTSTTVVTRTEDGGQTWTPVP